jgi:ATP-dependent Clp protease ATP-binding subunit ClpA
LINLIFETTPNPALSLQGEMPELFTPRGHLSSETFIASCWACLERSLKVATTSGWDNLRTPHIVTAILYKPDQTITFWAEYAEFLPQQLAEQLQELFKQDLPETALNKLFLHREFFSNSVIRVLQDAQVRAALMGRLQIQCSDLICVVLKDRESVVHRVFANSGLQCDDLLTLLETAEQTDRAMKSSL